MIQEQYNHSGKQIELGRILHNQNSRIFTHHTSTAKIIKL